MLTKQCQQPVAFPARSFVKCCLYLQNIACSTSGMTTCPAVVLSFVLTTTGSLTLFSIKRAAHDCHFTGVSSGHETCRISPSLHRAVWKLMIILFRQRSEFTTCIPKALHCDFNLSALLVCSSLSGRCGWLAESVGVKAKLWRCSAKPLSSRGRPPAATATTGKKLSSKKHWILLKCSCLSISLSLLFCFSLSPSVCTCLFVCLPACLSHTITCTLAHIYSLTLHNWKSHKVCYKIAACLSYWTSFKREKLQWLALEEVKASLFCTH